MTDLLRALRRRVIDAAGTAMSGRSALAAGEGPSAPPTVPNDTRKPLAALTFVWNEVDYLRIWVSHYGREVGLENCFVVAHGNDPIVAQVAAGCTLLPMPRSRVDALFARRKSDMAAGLVAFLLAEYKTVIVGDVDEYVVVDPALGLSLESFVARNRERGQSLKPLNLDMLDRPGAPPLDPADAFFAQRDLARTRSQFCKPVIVSDRVTFAAGFHYSDHYPVLAEGAYLVHVHFADRAINARIDADRRLSYAENAHLEDAHQKSKGYWSRHLDRYHDRNRRSAKMRVRDLDDMVPDLVTALNANVVRVPRTRINEPGWTMSFGGMDERFRLRIPKRFATVL